ncbi:hypothetical protein V8C42DRAFT_330528 [Trichoderma barbatum]
MASKDREKKRGSWLDPRTWKIRSRSSSASPKEHRPSRPVSSSVSIHSSANKEPSCTSLLSQISTSSSRYRQSTPPTDPQFSQSALPLTPPEPQSLLLPCRPLSSAPLPSDPPEPPILSAAELSEPLGTPPIPPSDLWNRAFREADDETQKWIRAQGLDSAGLTQPKDQIKELIGLVNSKKLSENNDEPIKIEIGNQKIIVREYIADAVAFITMVGDAAIAFAPPQASAPWAVAKAVLKIPVKQIEQKAALLGTAQWFARIVRRGQIYEALYKAGTADEGAILNVQEALLDVYIAALELLAKSDTLFDSGTAKQTLKAIINPDGATGKVNDLSKKEQQLDREAQACESSRSAMSSKQAIDEMKDLKKQLDQLLLPLTRIDKTVASLLRRMDENKLEELIQFISPEMFGKSHAAVTEARIDKTGDWLLADKDFRAWQDIPSSSSVLCLKGTVGTGKTYLTSKVVDHVKQTLNTSQHDEGFAFFYCNRSGPSMQDPIIVLRSFVRQLAGKAFDEPDVIQSSLVQKCQAAKREGRDLGYKDCKDLILESLNLYSKTTIILDALDESDISTYNLCTILIEMMENSRKPVKIFISTRPDREYLNAFGDKCIITVDASNQQGDIDRFLTEKLYSDPFFTGRRKVIQEEIKNVFTTRSCGMFRWVYLQVKSLLRCTSDDAIHNWTHNLPVDLMAAYEQLWETIKGRDEHDVALAERAIMWVLCSFEPLESEILLEAIQYAVQGSTVVQKDKQTRQQILSLCQDLLTIDEGWDVWMLPHASVAEYFETKSWMNWKCDVFASKVCLGFLENFQPEQIKSYTFAHYVYWNWQQHVGRYDNWLGSMKEGAADADLVAALKRFLGSPDEGSASYRKWAENQSDTEPTNMALFAVCQYGFYYALSDWWLQGTITEEKALIQNIHGQNSLELAAKGNCMPICRHLVGLINVEHPNAKKHAGALIRAINTDNFDILEFLVTEANADVNFPGGDGESTAAQQAAMEQPKMLQWMVDQGIVDLQRENDSGHGYGSVLIAAAGEGNVESVQILLKAGADVNAAVKNGRYGSALAVAAYTDNGEAVRLLLDGGADPNLALKCGRYGSALVASVARRWRTNRKEKREEVVHMLLEAGADPTVVFNHGEHGSALVAVAFYGQKDLLKTMIDRVGTERAIEALRQSRHPYTRYLEGLENVQEGHSQVPCRRSGSRQGNSP